MNGAPAKTQLRQEIRARLNDLPLAQRALNARHICERVTAQEFWPAAKTLLLFAPLPDEINIWPLLERALAEGKNLALPRYNSVKKLYTAAQVTDLERNLVSAAFEILEPAAHCDDLPLAGIAAAVIPGLAFDHHGHRLGRGRGFYDRLLSHFGGLKCGVALDEQIVPAVLAEPHDVRMNLIVTPTRTFLGTP